MFFDHHYSDLKMKLMIRSSMTVLLIMLGLLAKSTFAQKAESAKGIFHFSGAALVTNNGISLIPSFSLDKPAAQFSMSMGKRRLSFDPDLRFSLEGKPWFFIFWWRYKLLLQDKFRFSVGVQHSLNFRTVTLLIDENSNEVIATRRFLAGEIAPSYLVAKNVNIGIYYLFSHNLEKGATRNTHFFTLNSNFSYIKLSNGFFMRITPQLYYLKLDKEDGIYMTSAFTLAKRDFPLSLSAIINKSIQTDILIGKPFVWNVSLIYSFSESYVEL